MFYKIDPTVATMSFDLALDGFRAGDRIWVRLVGDFQDTFEGEDMWRNSSFEIGSKSFFISPSTVKAKDTAMT